MTQIKVSVIIPVYNVEDGIKKCLDSVISQSLNEIEIICIDDASNDNSLSLIKNFSRKYEQIKYIELPENSGAGVARNTGLEHATGEYISFIDSDDFIIDNNAYKKLYEAAKKNNANVVSANFKIYNNDGELSKSFYSFEIDKNSTLLPEDYGIPWFFWKNIFKKQFLKENNIKFPDYIRGEDPVFLAEVLKNVDIIHCLPIDFYGYNYSYQTTPYKVTDKESEFGHIIHYKAVLEILDEPRFTDVCLEYEKMLYEFLIYQKFQFLSESIDDTVKSVFGEDNKVFINYKLKCSLETQKKLENENKLLQNQLSTTKNKRDKYVNISTKLEEENEFLQDQLDMKRKELAEYLTTIGYLKYKSKNITTRLENKLKWHKLAKG